MNYRSVFRFSAFFLALGLSLAALGCDKGAPKDGDAKSDSKVPAGGSVIAVVDLDKVANSAGWIADIQKDNEALKGEFERQVKSFQNQLQKLFEEKKAAILKAMGQKKTLSSQEIDDFNRLRDLDKLPLTREQRDELVQAYNYLQGYAQGAERKANETLQQRVSQIAQISKEALRPVVRRVASANGVSIVFVKSDAIFHSEGVVDITDKVIDELDKSKTKPNFPAPPKLELPPVSLTEQPKPTTSPSTKP